MQRTGLAILAAAGMFLMAPTAWAQQTEAEVFSSVSGQQLNDQREITQANIDRATKALQVKDFATARRYAQPVTRSDPKRVEAWLMLGAAYQGLQDWPKARSAYATAVRLSPAHPEARAGLGVALAKTKDPKATVQLAWLDERIASCGGCYQAAQLTKFKADVAAAIAEWSTGS